MRRFSIPPKEYPKGASGDGAAKVPLHLYSVHLQCNPSEKHLLPACTVKGDFIVISLSKTDCNYIAINTI